MIMAFIFALSSRSSNELPDFGSWDYLVKKGGHMLGYGLLALTYWRGFKMHGGRKWLAWALAVCYAITDEVHQGYVPGRHSDFLDVLLFDNSGAMLALYLWDRFEIKPGRFQGIDS